MYLISIFWKCDGVESLTSNRMSNSKIYYEKRNWKKFNNRQSLMISKFIKAKKKKKDIDDHNFGGKMNLKKTHKL